MYWNSDFCKQRQFNYVHADDDCDIHLQGINAGITNVDTYRDRDRQGQTGTDRDRNEQTSMNRQ